MRDAMTESPNPPPTRTREQLDAILRARAGTLEETPYPILLLALALREKSAVLELRRKHMEKNVVFDGGSPVECRSNIATETLGRFLVAAGKLSEQDCLAALNQAASQGVPLGEILTARKLLAPTELYRTLQHNLGRKLLEPFSWKDGSWEISYDVPPALSVLRVKVPQLLVTGIMKVETQESAEEAVAFAKLKYLGIAPDPLFDLEELRLTADQQKVVEAARRGTMLDEIRLATKIDAEEIDRIVYALLLLGVVMATDKPVRAAPRAEPPKPNRATAPAPPAAASPSPPAAPPLPAAAPPAIATSLFLDVPPPVAPPKKRGVPPATAEEVMNAYLRYRRRDAFDQLGAAETDGLVPITKVFLHMADKFLPSRFDPNAPDTIRDKAEEVFLAAVKAFAELADPDRREALIKKRVKSREIAAASAQLGTAAIIDPEVLCKTGQKLVAAGKLRDALSNFEIAAESDAQNGTYAAEAAWCRYQLRISPPSSALKMVKNALRVDPNSAAANLYYGKLHAEIGNRMEAEAYLNRAAVLMPGDPRAADALKALKTTR
jgi:hypothetical protein